MKVSLTSYGGSDGEVTGSKHIIKIGDKYILIDYGAWQGNQNSQQQNKDFECPVPLDQIETIILTHAHYDHCGLLPKLIKAGYSGKIRSTPATRDLASIIMLDSAKIQSHERIGSYYEESDVVKTINQFRCHFYHKQKYINDKLKVTFYDAGHILGSALVDLEIDNRNILQKLFKKPLHVLFTGDLGRDCNPITNKPETKMPAPDYIIMESTYGNKSHQDTGVALKEFANIINRTIERGGKVIIPTFAIERAQELIYHLKTLMKDEKIPRLPVYVDSPMAVNATGVFNIHPECFNSTIQDNFISKGKNPFSVASLHCINSFKESIEVARSRKPCIVLAANGMCESGRIMNHLKHNVGSGRNTILMVGYQGENTLGRSILEKEPVLNIDGDEYTLRAEVQSLSAFSSHADFQEQLNWLKKIDTSKLKKLFLVHGDPEAQEFLKNYLNAQGFKNIEIIRKNTTYNL